MTILKKQTKIRLRNKVVIQKYGKGDEPMKARFVKKLMAISLSLAMTATMVPMNAAAADIQRGTAAVVGTLETANKESETQKATETTASTEKETKTYKTKVVLPGITKKTEVKSLSVEQDGKAYKYDYKGLETTDKGELTLKLPANKKGKSTKVVVNDVTFTGTVTDDDKAELKETKEKETEKATEKETQKPAAKTEEKQTEPAKAGKAEEESEKKPEAKDATEGIPAENLVISPITFESLEYGYENLPDAKVLTITNTNTEKGTQITGIEVSGELSLIKPDGTELPTEAKPVELGKEGKNEQFKIQPKLGLGAGEHKAKVTVKYQGLASDGTVSIQEKALDITITVAKKTLTLSLGTRDNDSAPYDGRFEYNGSANVTVTAAVTGVLAADSDKVKLAKTELEGVMQDANAGTDKAVSLKNPSDLALTGELAGNYQLGAAPAVKVTVDQKKVTASVDEKELETKKVYDKKNTIEGKLTMDGVLEADKEKVQIEGTFEVKSADAGTYTSVSVKDIKLSGDAAGNYTVDGSLTYKCDIEIEKADTTKEPKEVKISSYTYNSIKVRAYAGQEYCIEEANASKSSKKSWKSTKDTYYTFKGLSASKKYTITTRIAETKNYKASKEADYDEDSVTTLRNPVVADASKNTISGISDNGTYKVSNRITFTATGASTGMSTSSLDDVKYLPKSWTTTSTNTSGTWTNSPYSASFTPTKSGTYTLQVTYKKVKYDGSNWVDQNSDYVKKITFTVNSTGRATTSTTSSTNSSSTKKTTAAKTGDTSPIIPLVIVLVVCVIVIAGVGVASAKKKKNNK